MAAQIKNNFPKPDNGEFDDLFWKIIFDPVVLISCSVIAFLIIFPLVRNIEIIATLPTVSYTLIGVSGVMLLTSCLAYFYATFKAAGYFINDMYED